MSACLSCLYLSLLGFDSQEKCLPLTSVCEAQHAGKNDNHSIFFSFFGPEHIAIAEQASVVSADIGRMPGPELIYRFT